MQTAPKEDFNNVLQQVINEIRLLVVAIDKYGLILYANPFFLSATGYTAEEVLGKNIYKLFIPSNNVETFEKKIKAIAENHYSMQSENPILKKDGSKMHIDWHNFPINDKQSVIGVLSIGVDITSHIELVHLLSLNEKTMRERANLYARQNVALEKLEHALENEKSTVEKKVELRTQELNQEKARLLAAINSFPYGLLVTDNKDAVILANDRLASIFNVRKSEWRLNDLTDFLSGTINFLKYYGLVKSTKQPYLIKDVDLGRKFLEVYVAPIFLSPLSNETIGLLILITDITEQKILERSKDEFLSIASHELRTPLTAIRGNAELIKSHFETKINDHSFNEIITDIETSSRRLIDLVNEFLNMSRLEQGKITFKHEEFAICPLIENVIKELMPNAHAKNLYIKIDKHVALSNLPKCIGDSDRVREILINLIGNAITYTDRGGCLVGASVEGRFLKVYVTDSGKGIPVQSQNLLFRKFQQANTNIYTRDASRSTGLGLYISKLMIEAMRGAIYLEKSEVGKGSTFVFTLPLA